MIDSTNFTKAAMVINQAQDEVSKLMGAPVKLKFHVELYHEITPEFVLETVSLVSGIPVESIRNESRESEIVNARFVAFYLLRTYLFMTHKAIGRLFKKDHSTVMHGLKIINEQFDNLALQNLKERCGAKFLTNLKASYEDTV